jgi:hypothetical protein
VSPPFWSGTDDEPPTVRPLWASCPRNHVGAYFRRTDGAIWCPRCDGDGVLYYRDFAAMIARIPTTREAA